MTTQVPWPAPDYSLKERMTTTRQARLEASKLKLAKDLEKAQNFSKKVLLPICLNYIQELTVFKSEPVRISAREVRNLYGVEAARIFKIVFRLLQRGGINKNGEGFRSCWVVNPDAIQVLIEWTQVEETLKQLENRLKEANCTEDVWDRENRHWTEKAVRDKILAFRRKQRAKARKYIESKRPYTPEEREHAQSLY